MNLRGAFVAAALVCAGLLGFAYYLQYVELLDPCPLCVVQRALFYSIGGLYLIGALHNPARGGAWTYASLIALTSLAGAVTAGRHLWLQSQPPSQVSDCGPGLEYMIENWPLADIVRSLMDAPAECARLDWSFLGLSIPGWTLVWYLLLALWALVAVAAARPKKRRIFLGR